MKFVSLVWKNVWRRKMRTIFTLLSIFVAFLLFGILMTIRMAFTFGVEIAGLDRLVLIHKVSLIMPLPVSYQPRLQSVPGVELATHQTWFGGVYQDPSNFFAQIAVDPEPFLAIYPEFKVPPEQLKAWLADRQGALVGRDLAARFGWKVGDRIPDPGDDLAAEAGADVGVQRRRRSTTATTASTRRSSSSGTITSTRTGRAGEGLVGWYVVKIADPSKTVAMSHTFDEMFANSSAETKTTTEKGFVEGFAKQIGDIGAIMIAILTAVLFNILLIAASTMAQSVRERTNELAVLKTLGFPDGLILMLVLAESMFIALVGRRPRPRAGLAVRAERGSHGRHAADLRPAGSRRRHRRRPHGPDGCAGRPHAGHGGDAPPHHRRPEEELTCAG